MMTSRKNGERTRVMIVEQDLEFGLKLADWLATHGYHPAFIRTVNGAIDGLTGFRPQAVFVGLGCSARAVQGDMVEILFLVRTICPSGPDHLPIRSGDHDGGSEQRGPGASCVSPRRSPFAGQAGGILVYRRGASVGTECGNGINRWNRHSTDREAQDYCKRRYK